MSGTMRMDLGEGVTLVLTFHEGEQVTYSAHSEEDPDWRFTDSQGHEHYKASRKYGDYPTLRWVSTGCTMGHGDTCDAEGYWLCKVCGEEIKPGTIWVPERTRTMPGARELKVEHLDGTWVVPQGDDLLRMWDLVERGDRDDELTVLARSVMSDFRATGQGHGLLAFS